MTLAQIEDGSAWPPPGLQDNLCRSRSNSFSVTYGHALLRPLEINKLRCDSFGAMLAILGIATEVCFRMPEAVPTAQNDFWRPPVLVAQSGLQEAISTPPEVCAGCAAEFMVGSRFCHVCGGSRGDGQPSPQSWTSYLEFHNIKQGAVVVRQAIGLPLPSLVSFAVGVACLIAALMVGFIYSVQNFADFQAVQMWRMEWLLGAVAAFLAGILLRSARNPQK